MKKKLLLVTGREVFYTGKFSFIFLFDSKLNYQEFKQECEGNWGHLAEVSSASDKSDVVINIFNDNSNGSFFSWGNSGMDESWVRSLIEELPNCCLLMTSEFAQLIKDTCDKINLENDNQDLNCKIHHHEGALKTA